MRKILATIIFCIGSLVQQGSAQDFEKVIKFIGEVETTVKRMLQNEEAKRKAEIATLRSKLQELKPLFVQASSSAGSAQAQSVDVPQVAERNEAKEKQLAAQGSAEVRMQPQPNENPSVAAVQNMPNGGGEKANDRLSPVPLDMQAGVEISGFFDITSAVKNPEDGETWFRIGQCEIDIARTVSEKIHFEMAVALSEGSFSTGSAFLDYHFEGLHDEEEQPGLPHSGLLVGQFDVPFGRDYLSIPSPDRPVVSTPLIVQKTIASLNSIGASAYVSRLQRWEVTVFGVNGSGRSVFLGGRAVSVPIEGWEVGVSGLRTFGAEEGGSMLGIDWLYNIWDIALTGEVLYSQGILEGLKIDQQEVSHWGYYVQAVWELESVLGEPLFGVGRFSEWRPSISQIDENPFERQGELCVGLGLRVGSHFELRTQWQNNWVFASGVSAGSVCLQFVTSF